MPNPAVVYALIIATVLFYLSITPPYHPKGSRRVGGGHRHHRHMVTFDPLVAQLERKAEDQGLLIDVQGFNEGLGDELWKLQYYFGMEGTLNTTERLTYLFPLLDRVPSDGFISFAELEVWNRRQALERLAYETKRRLRIHDKDGNGLVTLLEFLPNVSHEEWHNKEHGEPGWWKDQFVNADTDANGSLNETEFNDFLHPEDSSNLKIQLWLQMEKLRDMDRNQDEKLSFEEFCDRTHGIFYDTPVLQNVQDVIPHETKAKLKFTELDVDRNKFLTAQELKPIMCRFYPGEITDAMVYTKYLMEEADDNKDGKLTLDEMLSHQLAFYNALYEGSDNDDDDDDDYPRDELR